MAETSKTLIDRKKRHAVTTALLLAGLTSATAALIYLPTPNSVSNHVTAQNPVVVRALKKAKKLQSQGKWGDSAVLLQPHATSENPHALLAYGRLLAKGWGVSRDLDKAREKLLLAVQQDFAKRGQAAFELARVYRQSSGKDCARIAFEWFSKSAAWGFKKAHLELGRHHVRGIGVPKNLMKALTEFKLASEYGSARALLSFLKVVSKQPELGSSLPPVRNLVAEAVPALEREATSGNAASAKALGRLYVDSALVTPDRKRAHFWLRRSADLGDSGAMFELALLMLDGLPTEVEVNDALDLMRTAVSLNNAGAFTEMGRLHLKGQYGLNMSDAVGLFRKGVEASHPGSMLELARLHLAGLLVSKDRKRALALLRRGASLGHAGSKSQLNKLESEALVSMRAGTKKSSLHPKLIKRSARASRKRKSPKKLKHPLNGATVITPFGTGR